MTDHRFKPEYAIPPGEIVLATMRSLRLTRAELASRIGQSPAELAKVIRGQTSIDKTIAAALSQALGSPPAFWRNLQINFDAIRSRMQTESERASPADAISTTLRAALRASKRSRYAIAKEAGLSPINLDRFLNGGDLKLQSADRIAHVLGLKLRSAAKTADAL